MVEQARQRHERGTDMSSGFQPAKDVQRIITKGIKKVLLLLQLQTGAGRKYGRNNSLLTQTKMARSISVKDVIAVRTTDVKIVAHSSLHYLFVSKPKAA
ncbi:hypothetical protein Ahy_B10g104493 [Arachis hypogaea]|uniref:Uncharacterized protein n=1 Tax=Arachis hypogaea TaxID=3818 RepID=A0A444X5Q5_ARAHY|nr:hypothetical protein Ahy_B10g104493 [Arachis hypogaea]